MSSRLKAGDWVWVRSKDEVLATLDKNGRLEELPFMPQMLQYCGRKFRVAKRAHKLCGTGHSTISGTMENAVALEGELRCDGQDFGGCEMGCLFLWKDAWLRQEDDAAQVAPATTGNQCTEADLLAATKLPLSPTDDGALGPRYVCQATQMTAATKPLPFWSIPHFIEDYKSGNQKIGTILSAILFTLYYHLAESGLGFGSVLRWLYDKIQTMRGKTPYVRRMGHLPMKSSTPTMKLNLEPGELVRIKPHKEILDTVNLDLINRGMGFHPELVEFCDKTFHVQSRVSKIINEKTGHLMELKNPCIVLDGVRCTGYYTKPMFCSRNSLPCWREIWLERVENSTQPEAERETVSQQST